MSWDNAEINYNTSVAYFHEYMNSQTFIDSQELSIEVY